MTTTAKKQTTLSKIVHVGSAEYGQVFCKVEIEDGELSISGVEGPMRNGNAMGGCGQIVDTLEKLTTYAPGWNADKVRQFVSHWRAWHLNGLRAGCEHQRAERWDEKPIDPAKPLNAYGKHFSGQKMDSWNMLIWIQRKEHPEGLLSHPCPVCGYKYGSAWIKEKLPQHVVDFMVELPDTDLQPAWV